MLIPHFTLLLGYEMGNGHANFRLLYVCHHYQDSKIRTSHFRFLFNAAFYAAVV